MGFYRIYPLLNVSKKRWEDPSFSGKTTLNGHVQSLFVKFPDGYGHSFWENIDFLPMDFGQTSHVFGQTSHGGMLPGSTLATPTTCIRMTKTPRQSRSVLSGSRVKDWEVLEICGFF